MVEPCVDRIGYKVNADTRPEVSMKKFALIVIATICSIMMFHSSAQAHDLLTSEDSFTQFVANIFSADNSAGYLAVILVVSFFLGMIHALTPGHGKTIVSAYMVGTRGTVADAITLGIAVTAAHLSSVIIFGVILAFVSRYAVPEQIVPYLGTASGLIIVALGGWMLYTRLRSRGAHAHALHNHDGHGHHHDHHQDEGKPGRLGLITLGISGGMVPCYDAIVVLLLAFSLNRVLLGLSLITIFSLGLASVLIVLAVLFAKSSSLLDRHLSENGFVRRIPVVSAILVTALGILLAGRSFLQI
jgi:ABC-type nickel/cobalt efflux system permease component RcnA